MNEIKCCNGVRLSVYSIIQSSQFQFNNGLHRTDMEHRKWTLGTTIASPPYSDMVKDNKRSICDASQHLQLFCIPLPHLITSMMCSSTVTNRSISAKLTANMMTPKRSDDVFHFKEPGNHLTITHRSGALYKSITSVGASRAMSSSTQCSHM